MCVVFFCSNFEVLYFLVPLRIGLQVEMCGYGMARGSFTDMLHSSKNYRQVYVTDCREAYGIVILRSDGVANLYVKWNFFRIMVVGSKCYPLVARRMKVTLHPC